ncbi:MAG: hypothetical protein AB7X49_10820 [Geminicoccaceae bacterium]
MALVDRMFGRGWAVPGRNPADAMEYRFAVASWLEQTAAARAALCDANHFLYLARANQLFLVGHGGSVEAGLQSIAAPILLIASADDLVFPPQRHARALRDRLAALGKQVSYTEVITTDLGHLDGLAHIDRAGPDIAAFLTEA